MPGEDAAGWVGYGMVTENDLPCSLYIHIPFCDKRCAYCDFNTYAGLSHLIDPFVEALCSDIRLVGKRIHNPKVDTIFFGGGTPTLLSGDHFKQIFSAIRQCFQIMPGAEISLEANPGTIAPGYFEALREVGFNRVSFGVQSADPRMLKFLDRIHSFEQVIGSVEQAKGAGFNNFNLDLIFGIPGQSMNMWQESLKACADLQPSHLSAYALGIETGTPLQQWYQKGLIEKVDDDLAADQFDYARQFLGALGYDHYEISNWCKPGSECRHNLRYWRNGNYLAFGPGAHGRFNGLRYSNVLSIPAYIKAVKAETVAEIPIPCGPSVRDWHKNTLAEDLDDRMMCGLRLLNEGVIAAELASEFGIDLWQNYAKAIQKMGSLGLIEVSQIGIRLSSKGVLLGNQVFSEFIGD